MNISLKNLITYLAIIALSSCKTEEEIPDISSLPQCQYDHADKDAEGRAWENGQFCVVSGVIGQKPNVPCQEDCSLPVFTEDPMLTISDPMNDSLSGQEFLGTSVDRYEVGSDGAFVYFMRIDSPAGHSDLTPKLHLGYQSNFKNGPLGWGWELSATSYIKRCPSNKRKEGYVSGVFDGDDYQYCLGKERLVQISATEYRLEDESFTKFTKSGDEWEAVSREGVVLQFGINQNAKVRSQAETHTWYLEKETDVFGNIIEYRYINKNNTPLLKAIEYGDHTQILNAPLHVIELYYEARPDSFGGYHTGSLQIEDQRISDIEVKTNDRVLWTYGLTYQDEEQSIDDPAYKSRLVSIQKCWTELRCQEPTRFEWSKINASTYKFDDAEDQITARRDELRRNSPNGLYVAHYFDVDANGVEDAYYDHYLQSRLFEVQAGQSTQGLGETFQYYSPTDRERPGEYLRYVYVPQPQYLDVDMNRDGYKDIVKINPIKSGVQVFLNIERNGERLISENPSPEFSLSVDQVSFLGVRNYQEYLYIGPVNRVEEFTASGRFGYDIKLGDFDRDGYLDLMRLPPRCAHASAICEFLNPGELTEGDWPSNYRQGYPDVAPHEITVLYNDNGKGWINEGQPYQWSLVGDENFLQGRSFFDDEEYSYSFDDLNGDGHPDMWGRRSELAAANSNSVQVLLFQHSGSSTHDGVVMEFQSRRENFGSSTNRAGDTVGDFDGDGLMDLLVIDAEHKTIEFQHNRAGDFVFEPAINASFLPHCRFNYGGGATCHHRVIDFNNDGMDDIVETAFCTSVNATSDEELRQVCSGDHPVYQRYSAQVYLSLGVDENGHIKLAEPIVFDGHDTPYEIDEDLNASEFVDINNDGMLENRETKTNQLPYNNIVAVVTPKETVNLTYKGLESTSVLLLGNAALGDLILYSRIRSQRENMPIYNYPRRGTRKLLAVDTMTITQRGTDHSLISEYDYQNMLFDVIGEQSIGFERVIADQHFYDRKEILRTITEYHQHATDSILLKRRPKRRQTIQLNSETGQEQILMDEKFYWKLHDFDDALGTSPHYFAYHHASIKQSWDTNGSYKGSVIQRHYPSDRYDCDVTGLDHNEIIISLGEPDFYFGGVPKEESMSACDAVGEAGSPLPMIQINAKRYLDVREYNGVSGLAHRVEEVAWFGESTDTPVGDLWQRADFTDMSETQCTQLEQDQGVQLFVKEFEFHDFGALKAQTDHPGTNEQLRTEYTYNPTGLIKTTTQSWESVSESLSFQSRSTQQEESFEDDGRRVVTKINELNQRSTHWFDPTYNQEVESVISQPMGASWSAYNELDDAGRVAYSELAEGVSKEIDYRFCNGCEDQFSNALYYRQTKEAGRSAVREYYDSMGRKIGVRRRDMHGEFTYQKFTFDALGKPNYAEEPRYLGDSPASMSITNDILGRPTRTSYSGRGETNIEYSGLKMVINNQNNQTQTRYASIGEMVLRSVDNAGTKVDMTYWPSEEIKTTKVNEDASTLTCMSYNRQQKQISLRDRNIGVRKYKVNVLGLVASETDSLEQEVKKYYDPFGRIIRRVDNAGLDAEKEHVWFYDNMVFGALDTISGHTTNGQAYRREFVYNQRGGVEIDQIRIGSKLMQMTYFYDDFGRALTSEYPSGYQVSNIYNTWGHMEKLVETDTGKVLREHLDSNAAGQATQYRFGDTSVVTRIHDPITGRLSALESVRKAQTLMAHTYTFDNLGNLESRSGEQSGQSFDQSFCYDGLNRLTSTHGCGTQDYGYDELGNMNFNKKVSSEFGYGEDNAGPHALTSIGPRKYTYNDNGNMVLLNDENGIERSVEYSIFNTPMRMQRENNVINIDYSPDGNRVFRNDKRQSESVRSTYYFSLSYEETLDEKGLTHHVHFVGDDVVVDKISALGDIGYEYEYQHKDHLGSVVVKSSESTTDLKSRYYTAWGERLIGGWDSAVKVNPMFTDNEVRGFTGHEHLDMVGLIHMNGRVYDPEIGRFVSPDPMVQAPFNSQSYNRYAYAFNNPLSAIDPSGFKSKYTLEELIRLLEFLEGLLEDGNLQGMDEGDVDPDAVREVISDAIRSITTIIRTPKGSYSMRCVTNIKACAKNMAEFLSNVASGQYANTSFHKAVSSNVATKSGSSSEPSSSEASDPIVSKIKSEMGTLSKRDLRKREYGIIVYKDKQGNIAASLFSGGRKTLTKEDIQGAFNKIRKDNGPTRYLAEFHSHPASGAGGSWSASEADVRGAFSLQEQIGSHYRAFFSDPDGRIMEWDATTDDVREANRNLIERGHLWK